MARQQLAVGIPVDVLHVRPDLRRAERSLCALGDELGLAEPDLEGLLSAGGQPRTPDAPAKVRLADQAGVRGARLKESVVAYDKLVLRAGEEAENGLVAFLRAQYLAQGVAASQRCVTLAAMERQKGMPHDAVRAALLQQKLVRQQDLLAEARGQMALGLIQVYRALGGGWQVRLTPPAPTPAPPVLPVPPAPPVPMDVQNIPAPPEGLVPEVPAGLPRVPLTLPPPPPGDAEVAPLPRKAPVVPPVPKGDEHAVP